MKPREFITLLGGGGGGMATRGARAAADTNHLISPRDEYCGAEQPMYMNPDQDQHRRNRLLAALRPGDYALLEPHLQIVPILEGEFLHLPGEEIEQVYFLHRGIVALMAISKDGDNIATASVGNLLTRYHMALMCQVQQTSLCNSVHDAPSRLSRLLLVLSEQGGDDTISFSQERL